MTEKNKDKEAFCQQAVEFFTHLAQMTGTEKHNTGFVSKHRIYIYKYQNGWFINREPLHYQAAGWVAESRERLHELLDKLITDIEESPKAEEGL